MDLLEQEYGNNNSNKSSKKKSVLTALMISIFLLIIAITALYLLPKNTSPKKETLIVNGVAVEISQNMILSDDAGNKYISIKELTSDIGYQYFNGEYGKTTEDKEKCYVNNSDYIVGFKADSNEIYKTTVDSITDYQYFKLDNKIETYNNSLYINIKDINFALNIIAAYNTEKNQTVIETPAYIVEKLQKEYTDNKDTKTIDTNINNENAIVYNLLVISENGKWGVLNYSDKNETIIGNKYTSLSFDEYTGNFIASNNNKYGIISKNGSKVIDIKYDEISIINYNPVLYKIKNNNKYGVIDKDGNEVVPIEYDKIGYAGSTKNNANATIVIKNLKNNKNGIVVNKSGKYGLINISNGEIIFECLLDAIYGKDTENDEIGYYVVYNEKEYTLDTYLDYVNTKTVNVSE